MIHTLDDEALDWAVAKALGMLDNDILVGNAKCKEVVLDGPGLVWMLAGCAWSPSSMWRQGGPLIERFGIKLERIQHDADGTTWQAEIWPNYSMPCQALQMGPKPLPAAMRAICQLRFGTMKLDIPKQFT